MLFLALSVFSTNGIHFYGVAFILIAQKKSIDFLDVYVILTFINYFFKSLLCKSLYTL